jgi:hypothetical protein
MRTQNCRSRTSDVQEKAGGKTTQPANLFEGELQAGHLDPGSARPCSLLSRGPVTVRLTAFAKATAVKPSAIAQAREAGHYVPRRDGDRQSRRSYVESATGR